jgi:hypothetical protein
MALRVYVKREDNAAVGRFDFDRFGYRLGIWRKSQKEQEE